MAKPKHITITQEGVITQEALLAYSQGKLSADEATKLEKLLRDDPFAQDALEGMRGAAAPGEMKSVITSLNVQLREKTGAREKKKKGVEIHWATYAYAAVIVGILVGLGFVMVHFIADKDQRIAMNKEVPQAQESLPVTEEKPMIQPAPDTSHTLSGTPTTDASSTYRDSVSLNVPVSGATSPAASGTYTLSAPEANKDKQQPSQGFVAPSPASALTETKPQPQKGTNTKAGRADDIISGAQSGYKSESNANGKATTDQKSALNEVVVSKSKKSKAEKNATQADGDFIIDKPMPDNTRSGAKDAKQTESAQPAPLSTDQLKTARILFDAGDYKTASKKYNEILSDQPDNADALYFGGISDYLIGKNKQAEKNFDKLLKTNLYVDGSKWYKANALIDRGKKEEAKQLLRDLINTNSSFKDRAVKKYEDIVK